MQTIMTTNPIEVRTCKFLLIFNNHAGEPSYWRLLIPSNDPLIQDVRDIHGKYLKNGGYLNEEHEAQIRRVQEFLYNSITGAKCMQFHEIAGHMGWDRVIISGISGC
jgi:hypothetical protein